jgi:hypothetical protein
MYDTLEWQSIIDQRRKGSEYFRPEVNLYAALDNQS